MLQLKGDVLCCPLCQSPDGLHLNEVTVAGRPYEDGPLRAIAVDSTGSARALDAGEHLGASERSHCISLLGRCDSCDNHFAIDFADHEGQTLVTATRFEDTTADGFPAF